MALVALGAAGVAWTAARATESYAASADWAGMERWLTRLSAARALHESSPFARGLSPVESAADLNRWRAAAAFDGGDVSSSLSFLRRTPECRVAGMALPAATALAHSQQLTLQAMLEHDAHTAAARADDDKSHPAGEDARLTLAHELLLQPLRACLPDGLRAISPLLLQVSPSGSDPSSNTVRREYTHSHVWAYCWRLGLYVCVNMILTVGMSC